MFGQSQSEALTLEPRNLLQESGHFRLSIVVPMFNEEASIEQLLEKVNAVAKRVAPDFEIILVNDGSSDKTLGLVMAARTQNPNIKIIDLSRNFGKEKALTAGLNHASGDAVISMDADLQHPPELIPTMIEHWLEGYDMVIAVRSNRGDESLLKRNFAKIFYSIVRRLSETPFEEDAGDFRLFDRRVIAALRRLPETNRVMKGLFAWVGFKRKCITFNVPERVGGATKWSFSKLWNIALDGIFSVTTLPLKIWSYLGAATAMAGFIYIGYVLLQTLIYGIDVPGYASLVTITLFFSGVNMIGLGIIGEYLGRVHNEVKRRPTYLVRDLVGFEDEHARSLLPVPELNPAADFVRQSGLASDQHAQREDLEELPARRQPKILP